MEEERKPYRWQHLIEDFTNWRTHAFLLSLVAFGQLVAWFMAPDCSSDWRPPYVVDYNCEEFRLRGHLGTFLLVYGFVVIAFIGRFIQATYNSIFAPKNERS